MEKTICALVMGLSLSSVSCIYNKSAEVTKEIQFISAYCSTEIRDVLVQNLYVQVVQQKCYPDSYKVTVKDCKTDNCSYIVPKEDYLKRL
jgi:hypothetical protein